MTENYTEHFQVKDGTLCVLRELSQDLDLSFDRACGDLLNDPKETLEIDLTRITYVNSTYMGMIAATFFQAQTVGKTLTVRAPEKVVDVFRTAGFDGFIDLQVG